MPFLTSPCQPTTPRLPALVLRLSKLGLLSALMLVLLVGETIAFSALRTPRAHRLAHESNSENNDEAKLESLMWVQGTRRECRKGVRGRPLPIDRVALRPIETESRQRSLHASVRICRSPSSCAVTTSPLRC
jgi:hypothetical protein